MLISRLTPDIHAEELAKMVDFQAEIGSITLKKK